MNSRTPDTPYCKNCGYTLSGLTDSARCPECGRPFVEIMVRDSFPGARGYRYQSSRKLFGLPLLCVASGPHGAERIGRPVGIIAIGDLPRGVVAIGGRAVGFIAIGGMAFGVISIGGLCVGGLAMGGMCIGDLALGGMAIGGWALGGLVFPIVKGIGGTVIPIWPW